MIKHSGPYGKSAKDDSTGNSEGDIKALKNKIYGDELTNAHG